MRTLRLLTIAFAIICMTTTLVSQTPQEIEELKQAQARTMADDYADQKDMQAQDKIVDPNVYIVGPGDQLTIFFFGSFTRENRLIISPEGSVLIPEFGEVYLGQITLADAKHSILKALKKRYRNVNISVTLSKLRKLKVSIDGLVNFPGIYTISSLDRVTEAIQLAGGLKDNASKRNIKLIRNGVVNNVDLIASARGGSDINNPYLIEGDKIFVTPRQINIGLVEIYGSVKVSGEYEFVAGERITDLVLLAGGLTINADTGSAKLVRFTNSLNITETIAIDLQEALENPGSEFDLLLEPDDRLFIRAIANYHPKAEILIEGEVLLPGRYAIKEDTTTLSEVISWAGGFTELASIDEAKMFRYGYEAMKDTELDRQLKLTVDQLSEIEREYLLLRSDPEQGRVSINFRELFVGKNLDYDVTLKDYDRIIIPKKSNTVRIMGRVLRPGLATFRDGATVDYYVAQCGGFTRSANKGKIRIVKSASGAIVKPSSKNRIEVGDEILVPEKRAHNWWEITKDVGLFLANLATVYIVIDQIIE